MYLKITQLRIKNKVKIPNQFRSKSMILQNNRIRAKCKVNLSNNTSKMSHKKIKK